MLENNISYITFNDESAVNFCDQVIICVTDYVHHRSKLWWHKSEENLKRINKRFSQFNRESAAPMMTYHEHESQLFMWSQLLS